MGSRSRALVVCAVVVAGSGTARAADPPPAAPGRWAIEAAVGLGAGELQVQDDGFNRRLDDFGFGWDGTFPFRYDIAVVAALSPVFQIVADFGSLDSADYSRTLRFEDRHSERETFSWSAHAAGAHLRVLARFREGRLNLYLQGGVGAAFGHTTYTQGLDVNGRPALTRRHVGRFSGTQWVWTNGLQWTTRHGTGMYFEIRNISAEIFRTPLHDRHDSGGIRLLLGARWAP